jgi:hypothetical protein
MDVELLPPVDGEHKPEIKEQINLRTRSESKKGVQ